jgi:fumarate reductase (CoM/CoB) subunit A
MLEEIKKYRYDIIVLGMGAAGLRAAIEAKRLGANTAIIASCNDSPNQTGATVTSIYSYCAPLHRRDTPEQFFKDTVEKGRYANNPDLVKRLADSAVNRLIEMDSFGIRWDKEADGSFEINWLPGHTYPRAVHYDHKTGKEIARGLYKKVKNENLDVLPYRFAVDFITEGNKIKGIIVINLIEGRPEIFETGAVILATGGASQLWEVNSNPSGLTGDGIAMALRAGAQVVDLEYQQFYPSCVVYPTIAKNVHYPYFSKGILINSKGERFLEKYGLEEGKDVRDVLAIAIYKEIRQGNGTINKGVLVDFGETPQEVLRQIQDDPIIRYLHDLGVNPMGDDIEIAPSAHFTMGGVRIDKNSKTSLEGLFACGEVCGGCHGANRLAGNALTETQVFGVIAGHNAALYANKVNNYAVCRQQIDTLLDEQFQHDIPLDIESVRMKTKHLKGIMEDNVKVVRNKTSLVKAKSELDKILEQTFGLKIPFAGIPLNYKRVEALKLKNMILVAQTMAGSALLREESRGAHFREDFPDARDEWKDKSITAILQNDEIKYAVIKRQKLCY